MQKKKKWRKKSLVGSTPGLGTWELRLGLISLDQVSSN